MIMPETTLREFAVARSSTGASEERWRVRRCENNALYAVASDVLFAICADIGDQPFAYHSVEYGGADAKFRKDFIWSE